jgi:hypothetical protein
LLGLLDVGVLAFLGATAEQNDQHVAILPDINAIPRPEVDAVFRDTLADRFYSGEVALLHAIQRCGDLGRGNGVESRKPLGVRRGTVRFQKFNDFPCRHA